MANRIGRKRKSAVNAVIAILGGGAVAAAMMVMPIWLMEKATVATGLSAILPAATPPLGEKARLILAFASGFSTMIFVTGIRSVISRVKKGSSIIRIGYEIGYEDEGERDFGGSGFAGQPRRPLFASSDLEGVAPLVARPAPAATGEAIRMPLTPAALDEQELQLEEAMAIGRSAAKTFKQHAVQPTVIVEDPSGVLMAARMQPSDYSALSITELVARFERGLSHRRQLIAEAVAAKQSFERAAAEASRRPEPSRITPPPKAEPEARSIDAEVDEALRAALGTLQRMTARAA